MAYSKYFRIVENPIKGEVGSCVELTNPSKYKGIVIQYDRVQLIEEENTLRVKFDYFVVDNKNKKIKDEKEFENFISKILDLLLFAGVETGNVVYGKTKKSDGNL